MTKTQKARISLSIRYVLLTIWALIVVLPLYWIVATSFKPSEQWFAWPAVWRIAFATCRAWRAS